MRTAPGRSSTSTGTDPTTTRRHPTHRTRAPPLPRRRLTGRRRDRIPHAATDSGAESGQRLDAVPRHADRAVSGSCSWPA
jgi:hypothetical protein